MGAGQSSSQPDARAVSAKTSYYVLLDIERSSSEDEIKKAYRRKALELHPDRNRGNVEEATRLFAEVQTAYEVLSDPHERAWYDSHESAILRGDDIAAGQTGQGGDGEQNAAPYGVQFTCDDDIARLLRKFSGNVKYTNEATGFYGYLRDTFALLAAEENDAVNHSQQAVDLPDYPDFGYKDTEPDNVKQFYAAWSAFATRKSFAWRDMYRLSEAPDRRYRRVMEQENKKLRERGIRDFNDAVRSMVAFVRKRDPRYQANTQTEAQRQQAIRDASAAQAAKARAANEAALAAHVQPAWTQVDEAAKDEHEGDFDESEEEETTEFECVACHKIFKTENQWSAHEKSKKHLKAVKVLQAKMRRDQKDLDLDGEHSDDDVATPGSEDELASKALDDGHNSADEDLSATLTTAAQLDEDEDETMQAIASGGIQQDIGESLDNEADDNSTDHDVAEHRPSDISSQQNAGTEDEQQHTTMTSTQEDDTAETAPKQKMGKAAQKRAKRAAAAANDTEADEKQHSCSTCQAVFASKTRLFQHIKDHGHGAPKVATSSKRSGRKGTS